MSLHHCSMCLPHAMHEGCHAQGHHGDTSRMFYVGNVSPEARRLCETTERALHAAIAECKPGMPIKLIGDVIQVVL